MKQFLRNCTVSLEGSSNLTIPGGGPKDLSIEFLIGAHVLQSPNPGRIRVYNPSLQAVASFKNSEFKKLTLHGGYNGRSGYLYSGTIRQHIFAHTDNQVDSYLDIFCADGDVPYNQADVSRTLSAGWTPRDKVQIALDAMKPYGITGLGLVNVDLSTPAYPRGRAFIGMARDLIRQAALSAGATWCIYRDQVHIIDHNKPVQSDGPIVLNSKTGLVGYPQQVDTGIVARCLINPAIGLNTQVKIDEASIVKGEADNSPAGGFGTIGQRNTDLQTAGRVAADGLYRVAFMELEGQTRGLPWYMTLTCIAQNGGTLTGQQAAD